MADEKGGHPGGHPGGKPGGGGGHPGGHPGGKPGGGGGHPGGKPAGGGHPGGKPGGMPSMPAIDLDKIVDTSEKGAEKDGVRQTLDRRIYMQLLVFDQNRATPTLIRPLEESGFKAVLYKDFCNPHGVGLLTMSQDPDFFVTDLRHFLKEGAFSSLVIKPEYTMVGRTYAIGHEQKLEDWLIHRPGRVVCNPDWQWSVWYPLKRTGAFSLLPPMEQAGILMEHGIIGRAFGQADLGHDIRLACHGLDKNDCDFVIGLIGKDLFPLSKLVQTMRSTKQTSTYIDKMGPFFIGKAVWQSKVE